MDESAAGFNDYGEYPLLAGVELPTWVPGNNVWLDSGDACVAIGLSRNRPGGGKGKPNLAEFGIPKIVLSRVGRDKFLANLKRADPFTAYPADLVRLIVSHPDLRPPLTTVGWGFHFLNLLFRYPMLAFTRGDLSRIAEFGFAEQFQAAVDSGIYPAFDENADVIQAVNKTGQWGLEHQCASLYWSDGGHYADGYSFAPPFSYATPRAELQHRSGFAYTALAMTAKEEARYSTLLTVGEEYLNAQNPFSLNAHRRPSGVTLDQALCAQPARRNASLRNRQHYDELGLMIAPSADELGKRGESYYTRNELSEIGRLSDRKVVFEAVPAASPLQVRVYFLLNYLAVPISRWVSRTNSLGELDYLPEPVVESFQGRVNTRKSGLERWPAIEFLRERPDAFYSAADIRRLARGFSTR